MVVTWSYNQTTFQSLFPWAKFEAARRLCDFLEIQSLLDGASQCSVPKLPGAKNIAFCSEEKNENLTSKKAKLSCPAFNILDILRLSSGKAWHKISHIRRYLLVHFKKRPAYQTIYSQWKWWKIAPKKWIKWIKIATPHPEPSLKCTCDILGNPLEPWRPWIETGKARRDSTSCDSSWASRQGHRRKAQPAEAREGWNSFVVLFLGGLVLEEKRWNSLWFKPMDAPKKKRELCNRISDRMFQAYPYPCTHRNSESKTLHLWFQIYSPLPLLRRQLEKERSPTLNLHGCVLNA